MNNKKDKEIEVNDYSKLYEDAWNYFYNKKKLPENPFKETDKLAEKLTLDIADKTDKALIESLNDLIKRDLLEVRIMNPTSIQGLINCAVKGGVQVVPKFDEYTKKLEEQVSIWKSAHEKEVLLRLDINDMYKKLESENSELKRIRNDEFEHNKVLIQKVENLSNENTFLKNGQYTNELIKQLQSENSELKKQLIHLSEHERVRIQSGINDQLYIKELQKEVQTLKGELTRVGWEYQDLSAEYEKLKSKYDSLTENLTAAMEAADFLNKFLKLEK